MRRSSRTLIAVLLAVGAGPARAAGNWADTTDDAANDPAFAASKAICRSARTVVVPPAPAPAAAPKHCSSERLYDGIGQPADPPAARRCAMAERAGDPDNEKPFAGTAMLMTMFANGVGAPSDLDVAIALACTLDGAPAEMEGRVTHLSALRKDGAGPAAFSVCDDATSGFLQGECAAHDSAIAGVAREADFARLSAPWSDADKAAFMRVRSAMEAFASARAQNEIDLSGTARGVFATEAADAVRDDLRDLLAGLGPARPQAPPKAALSLAGEDKALNVAYGAVMAVADPQWGTPTRAGIRATQRLWLAYRDALSAFATGLRGAKAAEDAAAALTLRRTGQLREFLG